MKPDYLNLENGQLEISLREMYDSKIEDQQHIAKFLLMAQAVIAGGKAIIDEKERPTVFFDKSGNPIAKEEALSQHNKGGYCTNSDIASNNAIRESISHSDLSGIPIMLEESSDTHNVNGTYIAFDEKDGSRLDVGYMVLSLYVQDGQPIIAVNFDPEQNQLYYAVKDRGSYQGNNKLSSNGASNLDQARVIISEKKHESQSSLYDTLERKFGARLETGLATGSRIASVITKKGPHDLAANLGSEELHVWDLGMILNATEAGAWVSRADGSLIEFDSSQTISDLVVSSNAQLHAQAVSLFEGYSK